MSKEGQSASASIIRYMFVLPLIVVLAISVINSHLTRRELYGITVLMYNFQYVDRIVVVHGAKTYVFSDMDYDFDSVKHNLYPFYAGSVGVTRRTRRNLQRMSDGRVAEITYFAGNNKLFAFDVYVFATAPFYEYRDGRARNVFMMDGNYALIFVEGGNFMGRFSAEGPIWKNAVR